MRRILYVAISLSVVAGGVGAIVWLAGSGGNPVQPPESEDAFLLDVSTREVQYGPHPWQVADIVFPHPYDYPINSNSPVVIWIHGGGWSSGSRKDIEEKVKGFVNRTGITCLNIDYSLGTREAPCWPQARYDIQQAVDFALGEELPAVSGPVYLYGYSAGGALAVKYALDNPGIEAVVAVSAPLSFADWEASWPHADLVTGFGDDWRAEDPASMTHLSWPHLVMLHGSDDPIVPMEVNRSVHTALESSRLIEIPGGDHLLAGKEHIEFAEALKLMLQ